MSQTRDTESKIYSINLNKIEEKVTEILQSQGVSEENINYCNQSIIEAATNIHPDAINSEKIKDNLEKGYLKGMGKILLDGLRSRKEKSHVIIKLMIIEKTLQDSKIDEKMLTKEAMDTTALFEEGLDCIAKIDERVEKSVLNLVELYSKKIADVFEMDSNKVMDRLFRAKQYKKISEKIEECIAENIVDKPAETNPQLDSDSHTVATESQVLINNTSTLFNKKPVVIDQQDGKPASEQNMITIS